MGHNKGASILPNIYKTKLQFVRPGLEFVTLLLDIWRSNVPAEYHGTYKKKG